MKVGAILAVAGAIVGEFLGSDKGLGYLMLQVQVTLDTPAMFMAVLMIPPSACCSRLGAGPRAAAGSQGRAPRVSRRSSPGGRGARRMASTSRSSDASFDVMPGELVSLVGPSAAASRRSSRSRGLHPQTAAKCASARRRIRSIP